LAVEAGFGAAARVMFSLGDVLGDALVRPGHVVVRLILSQHGVQRSFAEDQHAVEELTAQGADAPLAMASGPSIQDPSPLGRRGGHVHCAGHSRI